jgi:Ni,Fe-hydrogenase III large subunit
VLDRQLREQIAEHERLLATRPPDRREALVAVAKELQAAESRLANMDAVASETARRFEAIGPFAGLSRRGRDQGRSVRDNLAADTERATVARDRRDEVAFRLTECRHGQEAFEHFEAAEGWRRDEIPRL